MHQDTVTGNRLIHEQLRALSNNDEKALNDLYRQTYPRVAAYIIEHGGDEDEAKDVYQEAFIAVWRNIQANRFIIKEGHTIEGYLFRVSKFKWIDHLRSVKRKPFVPLTEDSVREETPDPLHDDSERIDKVRTYFGQLGENCRKVLTSFYYNKKSMQDIAADFGWTEPTAKNNKYRCLQKLRSLMNVTDRP